MKKILLLFLVALLYALPITAQQRGVYFDAASQRYGLHLPETAEPMTAAVFDAARYLEGTDSLVAVQTASGWGIFSVSGRTVTPTRFDTIAYDPAGAGALGFVRVVKDGKSGLYWLPFGMELLPAEFEATGVAGPNLVFGKRPGSRILEFFDKNAKNLFSIEGVSAYPCNSTDDFIVRRHDGALARINSGGQDYSKGPVRVSFKAWVFQSLRPDGEPETALLLNEAGDTLLQDVFEIRRAGISLIVGLNHATTPHFGLSDQEGKWLIPPSEKTIRTMGHPPAFNHTLLLSDANGLEQVWRRNGQLLLDSCITGKVKVDADLTRQAKNSAARLLFTVTRPGQSSLLGLFGIDGTQILPMAYTHIICATDRHPIIAAWRTPLGALAVNAFNRETGKKCFEEDFEQLLYTTEPFVFWGKKNGYWALLNLFTYRSVPPKFEIANVVRLPSLCFEVYDNGRKIVDPAGDKVLASRLEYVSSPTRRQFEQYFEKTGRPNQLVAVEVRSNDPKGSWRAIGRNGERYFFEAQTASTKPAETVVAQSSTEPLEVVVPPPSYGADEVMQVVSKPPQFPGGEQALAAFLNQHLKYPLLAKENAIVGKVVISFIVEKDGTFTDVRMVRDIGGGCGNEALRLLGLMPKWVPGEQAGRVVRVRYTLPILFHLD